MRMTGNCIIFFIRVYNTIYREVEMEGMTAESLRLLILPIIFSGVILLACIAIFCFTREESEVEDTLALRGQTANHTDAIPALKWKFTI